MTTRSLNIRGQFIDKPIYTILIFIFSLNFNLYVFSDFFFSKI